MVEIVGVTPAEKEAVYDLLSSDQAKRFLQIREGIPSQLVIEEVDKHDPRYLRQFMPDPGEAVTLAGNDRWTIGKKLTVGLGVGRIYWHYLPEVKRRYWWEQLQIHKPIDQVLEQAYKKAGTEYAEWMFRQTVASMITEPGKISGWDVDAINEIVG